MLFFCNLTDLNVAVQLLCVNVKRSFSGRWSSTRLEFGFQRASHWVKAGRDLGLNLVSLKEERYSRGALRL